MNLEEWITTKLPMDSEINKETFILCGTRMLAHGMSVEEVKEILQDLYSAMADEYGY